MAKKNKSPVSLNKQDWAFIILMDVIALIICVGIVIGISIIIKLILRG